MRIYVIPDTQPLDQKVSDRRIRPLGLGCGAAIEIDGVVNQLPVVLSLSIGKAKSGIYIAFANNMGHAADIPLNYYIVFVAEILIVGGGEFFRTAGGQQCKAGY